MKTRTPRGPAVVAGIATTALLLVAGCSSGDGGGGATTGADGKPTTLSILTAAAEGTPGGNVLRAVIADFEQESGITVTLEVGGDDVPTVFETEVAAGQEPDLVNINPVRNPLTWIDNGLVVPVDEYLADWGLADRILPDALAEWTRDSDGRIQGIPFEGYQWPVWYNTALLEQAGVEIPTTIDELLDAATALRAAGVQPFSIGGNDWSGQKLFLQIAQSYLPADDAKAILQGGGWCADPNAMKGIELFAQLRDAGVFIDDAEGLDANGMGAAFSSGRAAMMSAGSWEISNFPEDVAANLQVGGLAIPDDGVFDKPTAFQGTANGYWISTKGVANIEAIRQFITYLYSPEVAARFTNEAQIITALYTDADQLSDELNPLLVQVTAELPDVVDYAVMPDKYVPGDVTEPQIRQTALAFLPGTTADAICAGLDSIYG